MKKFIFLISIHLYAFALEFGYFGNIGTGYAGVALKGNEFAIFYNPALIAYTKKGFAYDFGMHFSQKNIIELTSIDENIDKKIEANLDKLTTVFDIQSNGANAFGDFSSSALNFATSNKTDANFGTLATALENRLNSTTTDANELKNAANDLKNKMTQDSNLAASLKEKLLHSIQTSNSSNSNLMQNIVSNVSVDNFLNVLSLNPNPTIADIVSAVGNINVNTFLDGKTVDDLNTLYNAIYDNDVDIKINTGLAVNIPNKSQDEKSGISMGVFSSAHVNAFAGLNNEKNSLIIKIKDVFLKLYKKDGNLYVSGVLEDEYNNTSAFAKGVKNPFIAKALVVTEVPVGYAQIFELPYGEISVGGNIKFINAVSYYVNKGIEINIDGVDSNQLKLNDELKNPSVTNTAGLDMGVLYSLDDLALGLVIKNINNPKIKLAENYFIHIHPQYRAGASYKISFATLALDFDLVANKTLSHRYPKSQIIGGGGIFDFHKWFSLKTGLMYDFKKDDGVIFSTGVKLFNIFDLSAASGFKTSKCSDRVCSGEVTIPRYFNLRLGFGYSW